MNTSPIKSCRVAIVGAGYMADEHAKAFKAIEGVQLVGIYSRTKARAEALAAKHGIDKAYESIRELYNSAKADLVVITVPELSVRQVCEECFNFPWTCLIEKPAGYNLADAETIQKAAESRSINAYVALNRRHYSSTRAVLRDLESNDQPRLVHLQDQEAPTAALKAGQPELVVENWMFANSIHVIDLFDVFARGNLIDVTPLIPWQPGSPGYVFSKLTYDSGDVGIYQAVWDAPGPWSAVVNTPVKRWEMRPLERASYQNSGERQLQSVDIEGIDVDFKPGLFRQAELAVAATRGLNPKELPTLATALKSMRLTSRIYGLG
jgi:predicted dehydrogenase